MLTRKFLYDRKKLIFFVLWNTFVLKQSGWSLRFRIVRSFLIWKFAVYKTRKISLIRTVAQRVTWTAHTCYGKNCLLRTLPYWKQFCLWINSVKLQESVLEQNFFAVSNIYILKQIIEQLGKLDRSSILEYVVRPAVAQRW